VNLGATFGLAPRPHPPRTQFLLQLSIIRPEWSRYTIKLLLSANTSARNLSVSLVQRFVSLLAGAPRYDSALVPIPTRLFATATPHTSSMPLRPFPYALRVGTDICNVTRIRNIVSREVDGRPFLHKFMRRILTDPERTYFWDRFGPRHEVHTRLDDVAQFLAGRFVDTVIKWHDPNTRTDLRRKKPFAKHATTSGPQGEASTIS
jgi:hypothetical protein